MGERGRVWTTGEHNVERRKFVLGVGALAAGGAAAMGSGAFDSASLNDRNADIEVTADQYAFLALRTTGSADSGKYASYEDDRLSINLDGDASGGGGGVAENSDYYFDSLFEIVNQGSEEATITIDGAGSGDAGKRLKWVYENGNSSAVSGNSIAPGEKIVVSLELSVRGKEAGTQISDKFTINAQT